MNRTVLLLILALFISLPHRSGAATPPSAPANPPFPFGQGERLTYDVLLNDSKMGRAVLEVSKKMKLGGRDVFHIVSRVKSNRLASLFVRIDDQVESYMDVEELYSHGMKVDRRRGKKREEKEVDFDQEQHQAVEYKNNRRETFDIPPKVHDFLSSLYFLRTRQRLEPGMSVPIDLHQNGKNWVLNARILGRELTTTPAGTFRTVKVEAAVPEGGLFKAAGDLKIWFTDDPRHLPVMMQSKGKVGLVVALLASRKEGEVSTLSASR